MLWLDTALGPRGARAGCHGLPGAAPGPRRGTLRVHPRRRRAAALPNPARLVGKGEPLAAGAAPTLRAATVDDMDEVDVVDSDLQIPCPRSPRSPHRPLFRHLRGWGEGIHAGPGGLRRRLGSFAPSGLWGGCGRLSRRLTPPAGFCRRLAAASRIGGALPVVDKPSLPRSEVEGARLSLGGRRSVPGVWCPGCGVRGSKSLPAAAMSFPSAAGRQGTLHARPGLRPIGARRCSASASWAWLASRRIRPRPTGGDRRRGRGRGEGSRSSSSR